MANINPYIHFNGNTEEAFTFYQSIFGGEFSQIRRYKEISGEQFPLADADANRLMHIALPISNGSALLGSDALSVMGTVNEKDNRHTIFIQASSKEEAENLYAGLSAGGNIEMPLAYGPTGSYFGMFSDKYGIQWMVDYRA